MLWITVITMEASVVTVVAVDASAAISLRTPCNKGLAFWTTICGYIYIHIHIYIYIDIDRVALKLFGGTRLFRDSWCKVFRGPRDQRSPHHYIIYMYIIPIYLSIYLRTYLSIHLSICLYIYIYVYIYTHTPLHNMTLYSGYKA